MGVPAAAQQRLEGIFGLWGAFRASDACHAVSEPVRPPQAGEERGFASIAFWPRRGGRAQPYVRLSRPRREGSAVLLRIDGETFQLRGNGVHAWPADRAADAAIVAAMRRGIEMTVETRSPAGGLVRDTYRLRGAATAIDAAAIACARRRP
jgi:hypothetical protein